MWHGRERLAQTYSQKALSAMAAGDPGDALWYANLALNNDRRQVATATLKERILSERAWEPETSAAREFIHLMVERERNGINPLHSTPIKEAPGEAADQSSSEADPVDPS